MALRKRQEKFFSLYMISKTIIHMNLSNMKKRLLLIQEEFNKTGIQRNWPVLSGAIFNATDEHKFIFFTLENVRKGFFSAV